MHPSGCRHEGDVAKAQARDTTDLVNRDTLSQLVIRGADKIAERADESKR